jgi:predicted metal-dependent phosphotriesterase family hydrolase
LSIIEATLESGVPPAASRFTIARISRSNTQVNIRTHTQLGIRGARRLAPLASVGARPLKNTLKILLKIVNLNDDEDEKERG